MIPYTIGVEGFADRVLFELLLLNADLGFTEKEIKNNRLPNCKGNGNVDKFLQFGTSNNASIQKLNNIEQNLPLIGVIDADKLKKRKELKYITDNYAQPFTFAGWEGEQWGLSLHRHQKSEFSKWLFIIDPKIEPFLWKACIPLNLLPSTAIPTIDILREKCTNDSEANTSIRQLIKKLIQEESPALLQFSKAIHMIFSGTV